MNVSIPGRHGFKRRSEQRKAALEVVWRLTQSLIESDVRSLPLREPCKVDWAETPGLDPADGELDEVRAERKRQQVTSFAAHALDMMPQGARVVEFGAGSGHVGILLAHLRPDAQVCLVEVGEYRAAMAKERVESLGIQSCHVFADTLDAFAATGEPFDLAIGLHTCGLLADAVLALAVKRNAAVCLVPCCYGQVASFKEDHDRGEGTENGMHPCSAAFAGVLGFEGRVAYPWCAKAADFTPGKGGSFDSGSDGFLLAIRCMRTVDADRLLWACEHGYTGALGMLNPPECSPKCSVLCINPPADIGVSSSPAS